jgi:hypothetical protein
MGLVETTVTFTNLQVHINSMLSEDKYFIQSTVQFTGHFTGGGDGPASHIHTI